MVWIGALLLAIAAATAGLVGLRSAPTQWKTEAVETGDLAVRVTAVGTVQPREVVAVGSQQSGIVEEVLVAENDPVTVDQPLLRLDTELLQLQRDEARAQVKALEASLSQAGFVERMAQQGATRASSLLAGNAVPPADAEQALATRDQSTAARSGVRAQLQAARTRLAVTTANLDRATVRSPIAGVILERNIDPGQSVVAALQAVTLFQVAASLDELLVEVDVDEADVPQVHAGQSATFAVSAWPDRDFPATVSKVHIAPRTNSGVVTYLAELLVRNPDGALLPGMTATARISAAVHPNSLTVPLAALRFAPKDLPADLVEPGPGEGRLWRLEGGEPHPLLVKLGPTDGVRQAVTGEIQPGDAVVVSRGVATP